MSIIHDALKKAQGQRKEKPAGIPYGNAPEAIKRPRFMVIGIVALLALLVLAYLVIPAFNPKKPAPVKQATSVKPVVPVQSVPTPAAPDQTVQKALEAQKPAGPVVQNAVNVQRSPGAIESKKVNTVRIPTSLPSETLARTKPVRRGSKVMPPVDDGPIHRISARSTADDSINRQYNEALRLMNAGKMREAQKIFLGILGRKPDHVEVLNHMGVISASLGNKKEAVSFFNKALDYRPNYPKAYNNLGLVMMSEGNLQLAEEYFRKAIAMDPDSLEPYLNLSALLRAEKKFPEAAKILEGPLDNNVKDPNLYLAYAVVKDNMGLFGQAIKYYRQYLGLAKPSQVRSGVVERLRYLEERGNR